ncbi:uncharacterized protein LOC100163547 isoform X2 [Acyrthosiphon pisum]|uniref:FHA domain-containing protein n=1 Tax=Acyrthosiphon pisum TaxID=7029 RepID=A0A8R2B6T8_ACYPI|nr:uncharacterized protein LOC100163547 isoform X2 [Acyrthosiphon pisum]|eukprot:XP_008184381.1 PREDICTED: uncharacterized protein LOC100163547 isoform X2 [Acyrthosiphon pisum]
MDSRKSTISYYGFLLVKKVNGGVCGRFPVSKKECTLGRDNNCDIRILLEKVSAQHCIIISVDNKAYVRDKSIAGSTKVNGKKVGRSNFLLHDSDEIDICGRKFVWRYPKKPHGELNNLSCKKSGIRSDHLSPRPPERLPNQVTTPLDNVKMFSTSAYSSIKTPSKTIISLNKTPIIVTTENMSKSSFDEVQNSFLNQSSTTTAQAESKFMKSYSMTPVRNIPLLGDYKTTQRKSWIVTNTSDNSSSIGAHNRLSTERLKRDSTPDLNSSYHYEDEDVEFDSPDPPSLLLNTEDYVDINTTDLADNIFPVENQSDLKDKDNDTLQFDKNEINQLSVSEPGTSRRDTYSVDTRPIVIEENTTPTPRRSILKCSKTTKPNRSRSSCRMVQFARLPKTDSKIKNTKTRLNPGFNFIVTEDENNVIDLNQSTTNSTQFDAEEYDDDLDGVQPLDISVSSLINSPILDNSIIKSSKRGSRGNKVMSLVNSIEKRSNESSKHSIRASDLLSMNGSKHVETSPNDDSQNNANLLQESVSSTRRINLEGIFEAEDSLKTTSNIENETLAQEIKESPEKSVEIVSSPKTNSFNITDTEKIPDNVLAEDVSKNDSNALECEYTFALPLVLPKIDSSSITVIDSDSAFVDTENDFSPTEIIDNQFDKNSKLDISSHIIEDCTSPNKLLTKTDNVERPALDHELSTTSTHDDNIDGTQKDKSDCCEKTVDEEICTDVIETPNNSTELSEKNKTIEKEHTQKQNDDVRFVNKSTDLNLDQIDKQNDVSKVVEQTLIGETPSIVVQSMSEMFNASIDEHETTHSQHKDNLVETYVLMGKDDLQNSLGVKEFEKINLDKCNKTLCENSVLSAEPVNKSLMDAIEVQLDKMHSESDASSNCNEIEIIPVDSTLNLNKQKTLTTNLDLEVTENLTLKINDNLSNSSLNTLTVIGSPEIISKPKSPAKDNLSNNCLTDDDCSNVTELPARTSVVETNAVQNIDVNNEDSIITIPPDNLSIENKSPKPIKKKLINLDQLRIALGANNSKALKKSVRSPINESIGHKHCKIDSTKKITEFCLSSSSDDENDTTKKNLDHSLDTSIGKPRFESTPWNCSKSSKTPFNSTASIQPNETTRDDSAQNEDRPRDKSRSRSVTPFGSQKEWSQMMKEFNESVKKASVNINIKINNTSNRKKKLFVTKSKLSQVSAQSPTKDSNMKNNTSEIKNNNSTPRLIKSSSMSNNTSNESGHVQRSLRNKSASIKIVGKSSKSNKSQTSHVDNYSSAETSNDNKILPRKKKSINNKTTDKRINKTVQANTNRPMKSKTIIPVLKTDSQIDFVPCSESENNSTTPYSSKEETYPYSQTEKLTKKNSLKSPSTSVKKNESNNIIKEQNKVQVKVTKDSLSSIDNERSCSTSSTSSTNEIQTFERELRRRKHINTSSIKTRKNTLNTDKVKTTEKSRKKNTSSTKRYSTNTNTALSESGIIKLDKKNKNVVKSKSTKISKTVKTKKPTNLRTNMNSRSKRLLPSKPIKTSSKDSSEYESSSEIEESTQKLQSVDHPSKSIKEKTRKKNVDVDINLSSLPTRRSQREKLIMSDVSLRSGKQIRKRAANMSPLTQNSKDKKKDILHKVVANPVSRASNSKQNSAVSNLVPDDSLPETTKKSAGLKLKKNSQLNGLLSSKPIKTNLKDSLEHELSTETDESAQKPQSVHCPPRSTKEKTKKKDVNVDDNLSSLSTKRNLREKSKTSDVSLLPPKTQSRKRAADTSPLSQPKAKGKKCDISSKVANAVSRASNSPNIRTRNMSKLTVKQVSDNSFPEATTVIKKERKKSTEKVKPKSNENTRSKKRQLNSDNCSFDSAPSTSKKSRQVTFRGTESANKKSDSSTCTTSKIQNTDDSIEPNVSLKVKYNKNAEKSISPIQRKTRNAAKQAAPKDKETFISPRVLRVRDKKK